MATDLVEIDLERPQADVLDRAAAAVRRGRVVAIPTDSLYSLVADPFNLRAVAQVFEAKGRESQRSLPILVRGTLMAEEYAGQLNNRFFLLARRFWPGPLTIIVRAGCKLPLRSTANTGNVALRVPDAAIPRAVVQRFGLPITATSSNLQGASECTHAGCVRDQIGDRIPLIVDGGPTGHAQPTTIVDLSLGPGRWAVLREGAIPTHEIVMVLQR